MVENECKPEEYADLKLLREMVKKTKERCEEYKAKGMQQEAEFCEKELQRLIDEYEEKLRDMHMRGCFDEEMLEELKKLRKKLL